MKATVKARLTLAIAVCAVLSCTSDPSLRPVPIEDIKVCGELAERVARNFDRLEDEMYRPDSVFHSRLAQSWPGDAQGRIVLGLVCDAQASGREPRYLSTILQHYPGFMNEQGYFGPVFGGKLNEQQLSGNGWVLRGLCQYYEWSGDKKALEMINSIVYNLFMKGKGLFKDYPIDPESRKKNLGDAIGEIVYNDNNWILSSDIGCIFIGMEGLIHAYKILGHEDLKELIDELVDRFLEVDLTGIRAQTHASLTACRGLIRLAEITGDESYIPEVQKRWELYRQYGMTAGYQNYNWFCREDTWSEPCAVVDSYMVAVQLWMHTGDESYLDDAELIYYNGICHNQRDNGGFGCDFCPSTVTGRTDIAVRTDEASWCCTMRGAEGLESAVNYSYFRKGNELYIPFYTESRVKLDGGFELEQNTTYPFEESVMFRILRRADINSVKLRVPVFAINPEVSINSIPVAVEQNGNFLTVSGFTDNDEICLTFELPVTGKIEENGMVKYHKGPMLLGSENGSEEKTPLYHLMNPEVSKGSGYSKTILFSPDLIFEEDEEE